MAKDSPTDELLRSAAHGNQSAVSRLLKDHRSRLRRMVEIHMDRRMAARIDPSDVVQESMAEAARQLPRYLKQQAIPFYPWLRQIAWEKLLKIKARHVAAQRRSVTREEEVDLELTDESIAELASYLVADETSPSGRLLLQERRERVRKALESLKPQDREVLVLRYLEQLSVSEATAVLGVTAAAFSSRHLRAIERLRRALDSDLDGGSQ